MDKKRACLEKFIFKRIPILCEALKTQGTKVQSICTQLATHLREVDAQVSESDTTESAFICDVPIAHFCGLKSRYALAVGNYVHQTLSTSIDCSSRSILESGSPTKSPVAERSHYVELARLAECKRLALSLETYMGAEEARLTSQVEWLNRRLREVNAQAPQHQTDSKVTHQVDKLRRHCDHLASELAHLDEAESAQARIEQTLDRQQTYLQRLDKVLDHTVDENAWLLLFTNLVRMESDSCQNATEMLQSLETSVDKFLSDSDKIIDRLSSARQTSAEHDLDQFTREAAVEQFEQVLAKVFRALPLPSEARQILDSGPLTAELVRAVLQQLQTTLAQTESAVRQTSTTIAKSVPNIRKQLTALDNTFHVPTTQTSYQLTDPHTEYVQADRLVATAVGLCAPDLLNSLATKASELASLVQDMHRLQLETDRVFALHNTAT